MTSIRPIDLSIENLFKSNYRPLCLYALHYLEDEDLVEDIVQECFTTLWEKRCAGQEIANMRAYLYTAVRNRCLDNLRKGARNEKLVDGLTDTLPDEEAQEDSQIEARLWTAIDSLPEKRREIFLLSKRDGLKYSEIAEKLGISANTVRNQISKALETIKNGAIKIYFFLFG